jgi:ABC-type uncharacterized transport system ATPase subunit
VFEHHTVFENLELAMAGDKRVFPTLFARLSGEQRERIDEVLGIIGLKEQCSREAGALSHGQKQWLEIGMLLMQDPHLLLVDEPVAGMTHQEMDRTAELLLSLQGKHSVVVVEHDMDFVRSIAKRVTVLHQGSVLAEGSMDEVQNDPRVVEVYLQLAIGRALVIDPQLLILDEPTEGIQPNIVARDRRHHPPADRRAGPDRDPGGAEAALRPPRLPTASMPELSEELDRGRLKPAAWLRRPLPGF